MKAVSGPTWRIHLGSMEERCYSGEMRNEREITLWILERILGNYFICMYVHTYVHTCVHIACAYIHAYIYLTEYRKYKIIYKYMSKQKYVI